MLRVSYNVWIYMRNYYDYVFMMMPYSYNRVYPPIAMKHCAFMFAQQSISE